MVAVLLSWLVCSAPELLAPHLAALLQLLSPGDLARFEPVLDAERLADALEVPAAIAMLLTLGG